MSEGRGCPRALVVLLGLSLVWFGLTARLALAETRHTAIALVSGGADAELHARLRAELTSLGWRVREMPMGADLALAQVARRAGTLAVLRVGRSAEGIEVWVAPEVDSAARSEWIDVDARRPELAVLRAVEALRARFLELGIEPEDAGAEPSGSDSGSPATPNSSATSPDKRGTDAMRRDGTKPDAPKRDATKPDSSGHAEDEPPVDEPQPLPPLPPAPERPHAPEALWLAASGGMISGFEGLGSSPSVSGAVRFVHHSWLGVDLAVWWPPGSTQVSGAEGFADVRASLIALGGEVRGRRGPWTFGAGGGVALALLSAQGYAQVAGNGGHGTNLLTSVPFVRLAGEIELVWRLRLRAEGMLGAAVPRAAVLFNQTTVVTWGRPVLAASLGVQWAAIGD